nr:MAG TPA: hypothetical protein [Caudoviricetes sp.]
MAQDIIARGLAIKALEEGGGGSGDHPVTSVNGKTGAVTLTATDVKALPNTTKIPTKTSELTNDSGFTTEAYVNSKTAPFVINLTEGAAHDGTYTADKQYAEIKQAYDDNANIVVIVNGNGRLALMNAEFNDNSGGFTFGYTQVRTDGQTIVTRSIHYLHTQDGDTWQDSDYTSEPLLLTGGTMDGAINMASNNITNVQKIHVNGQAPLYLGSTIEQAGTAGVRLTGTTGGTAAFVAPDSQSTYRPVAVGEPTANEHATNKTYVDGQLSNKVDKITANAGQLKAYCVNGEQQDQCLITTNGEANSIARYDANGRLTVKSAPVSDNQVATKAYVDSKGASSSPIVHDMYITGNLSVTGTASSTKDPVNSVDLVTKKYLDERFSFDETTSTLTITI